MFEIDGQLRHQTTFYDILHSIIGDDHSTYKPTAACCEEGSGGEGGDEMALVHEGGGSVPLAVHASYHALVGQITNLYNVDHEDPLPVAMI